MAEHPASHTGLIKRAGTVCLLAALPGLIIILAARRLFTVVTGVGDIMNYMISARAILNAADPEAWVRAVMNWAPLFPLSLAAIMRWSDPAYVYFLNPILTLAVVVLMGMLMWKARQRYRAGLLTALIAACWFISGLHPQPFAYFMIYPFREPMSFLFLTAGMLAVISGHQKEGKTRFTQLVLAGFCYVLSAGTREPAALSIAGAAAYLLLVPGDPPRTRVLNMLALAAPGLLALAGLGGIFAITGIFGSQQFHGWQNWVAQTSWDAWRGMMQGFLVLTARSFGWMGLFAILIGTLSLAFRNRALLAMLGVSVTVTFLFYSTFAVYPRYVLSFAIFLVPLAAQGLDELLEGLAVPFRKRPWIGTVVSSAAVILIALQGVIQVGKLAPMGNVSHREVRLFCDTLRAHIPPAHRLLSDPRSRPLHDALITHLNRPYLHTAPTDAKLAGAHYIFLNPLTPSAITQARVAQSPVQLEDILLEYADLEPLQAPNGDTLRLRLGHAVYAAFRVLPWQIRTIRTTLQETRFDGHLFWLDFRDSDPAGIRQVSLLGADGDTVQTWDTGRGNGLIPFCLDAPIQSDATGVLVISSSSPLPAVLTVPPDEAALPDRFATGPSRRPSILKWFAPPAYTTPYVKWGVVVTDAATLLIPVPRGNDSRAFEASLIMQPRFAHDDSIRFRYEIAGQPPRSFTNALDEGPIHHTFHLPPAARSNDLYHVNLTVEVPDAWNNHFRVQATGLRVVHPSLPDLTPDPH